MKEITVIDNDFVYGGFTSGSSGIWTRNEPFDPPSADYVSLGARLGISLSRVVRPYQASGDKVEIVSSEHGGSGVIKDNELKQVDGLVTVEKGFALSVIAADCVPVYLADKSAEVIGILHCGWRSAAGELFDNAVRKMCVMGASPAKIEVIIGPHICADCYEVGDNVRSEYAEKFTEKEIGNMFFNRHERLYLNLSCAVSAKILKAGISSENISEVRACTCCDRKFYSYRRGDRGLQNLAYIIMK